MRSSKGKPAIFWRIVITLIGIFLVFNVALNLLLFAFGDRTNASIQTRRFGGSQDAYPASKRYEWNVSYTFSDSVGGLHTGYTKRRGSDMSVIVENEVLYFRSAPYLNALSDEAYPSLGQLAGTGIGIFIIYAVNGSMNKRKEKKK